MRALIRLLAMLSLPAVAFAQTPEPEPVRTQFIVYDEAEIIGSRAQPQAVRLEGRRRPEFVPLVSLKRAFLSKLRATASEAALR